MNPVVVLDRDGVINHDSPEYIKSPREWQPIAGSLEAIARFTHAGYRVVVASNQSGIGRGLMDYGALFAIHDKLVRAAGELGGRIEGLFFCPHTEQADCRCRKPATGLFQDISKRLQVDGAGMVAIGDSWRDIAAAKKIGARPILVRSGNGEQCEREHAAELSGVVIYDDLAAAAAALLNAGSR